LKPMFVFDKRTFDAGSKWLTIFNSPAVSALNESKTK